MGGGTKFQGRFAGIYDKYRTRSKLVVPDTPRLNSRVKRRFSNKRHPGRSSSLVSVFGHVRIPNSTDHLWVDVMNLACNPLDRTVSSAKSENKRPHDL